MCRAPPKKVEEGCFECCTLWQQVWELRAPELHTTAVAGKIDILAPLRVSQSALPVRSNFIVAGQKDAPGFTSCRGLNHCSKIKPPLTHQARHGEKHVFDHHWGYIMPGDIVNTVASIMATSSRRNYVGAYFRASYIKPARETISTAKRAVTSTWKAK